MSDVTSEVNSDTIIEVYLIDEAEVQECIKDQHIYGHGHGTPAESDLYKDVHIIEKSAGFELVYGCYREGTGPFKTMLEAKMWFLNQGR